MYILNMLSKLYSYDKLYATIYFKYEASEAVKIFKDYSDILLVSWPPNTDRLTKACNIWGTIKPIVYIGYDVTCCADEEFFNRFIVDRSKLDLVKIPNINKPFSKVLIGKWS